MHRLGVALIPHRDRTMADYVQIAQLAERQGYESLWAGESNGFELLTFRHALYPGSERGGGLPAYGWSAVGPRVLSAPGTPGVGYGIMLVACCAGATVIGVSRSLVSTEVLVEEDV